MIPSITFLLFLGFGVWGFLLSIGWTVTFLLSFFKEVLHCQFETIT
jgi:hypothetical protein